MQPASLQATSEAFEIVEAEYGIIRQGPEIEMTLTLSLTRGKLSSSSSGEKRWGTNGQNGGGGWLSHPLPMTTIGAKHRGFLDGPVIICGPALLLHSPHKHTHSPSTHVSQLTFSNPPSFLPLFVPRAGIPALGRFVWIPSAIVAVSTATPFLE